MFFESSDISVSVLEIATTKLAELIEQLAEVDDEIVEHVLNDTLRSNAQLAAAGRGAVVSLKSSHIILGSAMKNRAVQRHLYGVCAYVVSLAECEVSAHDIAQLGARRQSSLFRLRQRRPSLSHSHPRRASVVTVDRGSGSFQALRTAVHSDYSYGCYIPAPSKISGNSDGGASRQLEEGPVYLPWALR
ncbi:hypothetical protein BJV78DRAFT_187161 [Lactifluus subvellereus]|nr:hypothetical protein BJV78DRAFT_187161 [Lactifluus subvellereus]